MKPLILVFLLAIFTVSVNAQPRNSLIYKNAIVKYKNMERTGTIISVIGGVTLFAGNIMYWKLYNGTKEPSEEKADTYGYVMLGGLGLMAVGIPLWATGKVKERQIIINAELVKFKGLTSANGIGLKIRF